MLLYVSKAASAVALAVSNFDFAAASRFSAVARALWAETLASVATPCADSSLIELL